MKYFFFFLLMSPFYTTAQITLQGSIVNSRTKAPVPFATVGLIKKNTGINANEEGRFQLTTSGNLQGDTLLITCTGYLPVQVAVASFAEGGKIFLQEDTTTLSTVVMTSHRDWQTAILNDFRNCGNNTLTSTGAQTEAALHLQNPGENGYLKEVRICHRGFGPALFGGEKTVFRLKIYEPDITTGGPGNSLCKEVIEVKAKGKLTNLNLEQYHIFLPGKDFFVSVEWLKITTNEIKQEAILNGIKQSWVTYRPHLSLQAANASQPAEIWGRFYNGKWNKQTFGVQNSSLSIAAIVKY